VTSILRFRKAPYVELDGGVITGGDDPAKVGQFWHFVDYVDEEGGRLCVWDGSSYADGQRALARWRQDGVRAVDLLGEALS